MSVNTTCPIFLAFGITQHFACCGTGLGKLRAFLHIQLIRDKRTFTVHANAGNCHQLWDTAVPAPLSPPGCSHGLTAAAVLRLERQHRSHQQPPYLSHQLCHTCSCAAQELMVTH